MVSSVSFSGSNCSADCRLWFHEVSGCKTWQRSTPTQTFSKAMLNVRPENNKHSDQRIFATGRFKTSSPFVMWRNFGFRSTENRTSIGQCKIPSWWKKRSWRNYVELCLGSRYSGIRKVFGTSIYLSIYLSITIYLSIYLSILSKKGPFLWPPSQVVVVSWRLKVFKGDRVSGEDVLKLTGKGDGAKGLGGKTCGIEDKGHKSGGMFRK